MRKFAFNSEPMRTTTSCAPFADPLANFRKSPEWVTIYNAGIASPCVRPGEEVIYHRNTGLIPKYSGHVPGERFRCGETFGNSTVDAKRWIALHRD